MAPYRSREEIKTTAAPETGLVADMVRQFADPYAFLRELAQNGIDAGATTIEVRIERTAEGIVATSVTDDGCGMTPEVIQGPLLTLFSSSKEGDTKKIGKYGVGFVSVFAIEPDEVQVSTWRDGGSWLLRLFRDHSYELQDTGPRAGTGTTVALLKRGVGPARTALTERTQEDEAADASRIAGLMASVIGNGPTPLLEGALADHEALALAALKAWCRHAQCPIYLTVVDHQSTEGARRWRIDTPLAVLSPFSVSGAIEEEELYVVGPSAGTELLDEAPDGVGERERSESFAGFYNRGLTLFETQQPLAEDLRGIRFKVMSPHLQHTLSRDNVRRDAAFERLVDHVRAVVKGELRKKILGELVRRAEHASQGEREDEYAALLSAALSPSLDPEASEIAFPLVDPLSGSGALRDALSHVGWRNPLLTASCSTALTRALAAEWKPVIRCSHPTVAEAVRRCFPKPPVEEADEIYLLVTPVPAAEQTEGERILCADVQGVLAAAGREVKRVGMCRLEGVGSERMAVMVPGDQPERPRLCTAEEIRKWRKRWSAGDRLLLNAASEILTLSFRRPAVERAATANLLVRLLLVDARGELPASVNERLLEQIGKGPE